MDWLAALEGTGETAGIAERLPVIGVGLLLLVLAAAEILWPFHDRRDGSARIPGNFGLGLLNMLLAGLLPVSAVAAAEWSRREGFGLLHELAAPAAAAVGATLLARSLLAYGLHRLAHRIPLLWRMHKVHHCDPAVDLSTGLRHHPLEILYVGSAGAAAAALLGLSPPALAAYELASIAFALWTHANIGFPERQDRRIALVLVTPAVHHLHHSASQAETDSNYGDMVTLWDRLFGTYRAPGHERVRNLRFGLGEAHDSGAANMLVQLRVPFSSRSADADQQRRQSASRSGGLT